MTFAYGPWAGGDDPGGGSPFGALPRRDAVLLRTQAGTQDRRRTSSK